MCVPNIQYVGGYIGQEEPRSVATTYLCIGASVYRA